MSDSDAEAGTPAAPTPAPAGRAGPGAAAQAAAGQPVGVLLPLRLETRFDDKRLRLRIIPDEPWFARHDPKASDGELVALERYVRAAAAGPDTVFPGRVSYPGAPLPRWWQIEEAKVDIGGTHPTAATSRPFS